MSRIESELVLLFLVLVKIYYKRYLFLYPHFPFSIPFHFLSILFIGKDSVSVLYYGMDCRLTAGKQSIAAIIA
jgi:hypothetical protein